MRYVRAAGVAFLCQLAVVWAQTPAAPASRIIGEVTAIDASGGQITLKTDKGEVVAVALGEKTLYLRVPPGEKDLKKASKITLAEVGQGDRLLARGRLSEDQKTLAAAAVIVMNKADLAAKHEQDRQEWQRRGLGGTISAVNPESRQFTITVRNFQGSKTIAVETPDGVQIRRYAPDSVRFSDAKPSSFGELKVGDHVRVLGDKNEDGSRIKAEQVVAGSFRTIAGTITTVNAASSEILIRDLATNKPLTVRINSDSTLRRLPPMMAAMMARRLNPESAGAGPGGRPPGPAGGAARTPAPGGPERAVERPAGPEGMRGPGGPRQGGDLQQMLERMPALSLAELKPGDALVISSTTGAEPTHVTAIMLVAGVEPLLTATPQGGRQLGGGWNLGDIGFPE